MLTHWGRDRNRGPRLDLPEIVRRLTSQPAALYGLSDRGRIEPGLRADLNVIDFERLRLGVPVATRDLPAGGVRMLQAAVGYVLTAVAGTVTRRNGEDTGARPGRLLRHG
jgi:N-acyl-D-aspartate/D-glutamate deacylase